MQLPKLRSRSLTCSGKGNNPDCQGCTRSIDSSTQEPAGRDETMTDEHVCNEEHEHGDEDFALELNTASQFLLEMRAQNLELLKIASQIAGYAGPHSPLKPNDVRQALRGVWDVYSELYSWVDPEEGDEEEEEGDEEVD
jgi:hypothetical protein